MALMEHGLFPSAPSQPHIAFSIELLGFFRELFIKSTDAMNSMAGALNSHYRARGFRLTNSDGEEILDPFRKSMSNALQWFECVIKLVDEKTEAIIEAAETLCAKAPIYGPEIPPQSGEKGFKVDELWQYCARLLRELCPACFGGTKFGRPFESGCDIVVCLDGNFNHRHLAGRGDCPPFWMPRFFLSKAYVDKVGEAIEHARKHGQRDSKSAPTVTDRVPDEAVDACEKSHKAGSESTVKTYMELFDDAGVMALVCRHDIPLVAANIDTPGEQQKYAVALIQHLFSLIPDTATVTVLYDVGCVLNRSREKYDIFDKSVSHRLAFATSIMHSYAHQHECQLINNPRYRLGIGLSDGEGTERVWSQMTGLVGIERNLSRHRRIFMLDCRLMAIAEGAKERLGSNLVKKLNSKIPEHEARARQAIQISNKTSPELKELWNHQKREQLSVRAHAPARIKKELDAVLTLQSELDELEKKLSSTRELMNSLHGGSAISDGFMSDLEARQRQVVEKVEELYASLNVHDSFPELEGIDVEFLTTLFLARDLKMNIRKRAVSSFFVWDKLNQAKGGREVAIGTKLHQYARNSMSKRAPALRRSIRRFNELCQRLADLHKPQWGVPVPVSLPEGLHQLQHDSTLMEDVWISAAPVTKYSWLYDADLREGMRGAMKLDRCVEECRRVGWELDNMCAWWGSRLTALHLAASLPEHKDYLFKLELAQSKLLQLQRGWSTTSTAARYNSYLENAPRKSQEVIARETGSPLPPTVIRWVEPIVAPAVSAEDADPEVDEIEDVEDATDAIPEPIYVDKQLLVRLSIESSSVDTQSPRVLFVPCENGEDRRFVFQEEEMEIMRANDARLTGDCINNCAALLHWQLQHSDVSEKADRCCIFSTYDILMARYNTPLNRLWPRTERLTYWNKSVWIFPIHRVYPSEHWVCIAVVPSSRDIFVFDSLNDHSGWSQELQEVVQLVSALIQEAGANGHPIPFGADPWVVASLTSRALQTTSHSCGVWVLAVIAALVSGRHTTDLDESGIAWLRTNNLQTYCRATGVPG
ncbi:hypothetical protein FA13DRAFT_1638343 [Coprinellus micaceus]|uniref:Ubiquitin-like protease family profile domain-containing protein n=1 Tax=Coprinellus micaceus TaxID=71717 RepID=A0A4Y7SS10_COPMI|nr:hypothetical protein FA13DRAFT_1638343 [Coprinellus micaceus]